MNYFKNLFYFLLLLSANLFVTISWAQDIYTGLPKLSADEVKQYREILDRPIDESSRTKSKSYAEKTNAAKILGDFKKAEEIYLEWSKIDNEGKGQLFFYYSAMGRFDDAIKVRTDLLKSYDPRLRWGGIRSRIFISQAIDYIAINNLDKAYEAIKSAESLVSGLRKNPPRGQDILLWILRAEGELASVKADYLMRSGKWDESLIAGKMAVDKYKETLQIINLHQSEDHKTGTKIAAARVMGNYISQQIAMGQFITAEVTLRETLKIAKDSGLNENHMFLFEILSGDILSGVEHYSNALEFFRRAQKLHLEQGYTKTSPRWMSTVNKELTALAGLYQWEQALKVLQEANQYTNGTAFEPKNTIDPRLMGFIQIKNNRTDEAIETLSDALSTDAKNYGDKHYYTTITRGLLGVAYAKRGESAPARAALEQARIAINSPESLSTDFTENAIQKKMNRFIFESYMQLLAKTAPSNIQDAQTLFLLADQVGSSSVQQALTEAAVRSGVNIPGLSDVIRKEQDAKNEMASLVTYIANQTSQPAEKQNPQIVEQMKKRLQELDGLRKGFKVAIQKGFPEYFQLIQPKAPSAQEIASLLADDEVFVSVLPMAEESYVWAINHKGEIQFHRSDWSEKKTHEMVDALRKTLDVADLGGRAPAFDHQRSHAIYKAFFEPIAQVMQGKSHLVVSTSGTLAKLPFAVLETQPFNGANAADAPWLIKSMAVSHVPTASGWMSLKRFAKVASSPEAMVAWGDPVFDSKATQKVALAQGTSTVRSAIQTRAVKSLEVSEEEAYLSYRNIPPLPETRDEVERLAEILGANAKNDLYLGALATRASVINSSTSGQLAKKQVVVFATHGLLAGDLPNLTQPALAMAANPSPSDSPLLTLEDVLSLKLNADWVVLSACNTAGADGKAEEAMSGLARGFFFAGSRSLLVTHWSVESVSAMLLTTQTFSSYKKDPKMRRAEALRQSMLAMMKTPLYTHPAYWAPYALVGDGGR